jgi:hypothetical protein
MESAICGRRAFLADIGLHIYHADLRAGNHRLSWIMHRARNRARDVCASRAETEYDQH